MKLYSEEQLTRDNVVPEIMRSSLDDIVLQLVRINQNPSNFPFLDAPDGDSLVSAIQTLIQMQCITEGCFSLNAWVIAGR